MLDVTFNDIQMKLPAGTLLTWVHCAHQVDLSMRFYVEVAQGNWMLDKVSPATYSLM